MNRQKRSMASLQISVGSAWLHAAEGDDRAARSGSGSGASYCRDVLHSRPPMAPSIFITIIKRTIGVTIGCDYATALIPDDCRTQLSRFPKAIAMRNDYYLRPLAFSAAAHHSRVLSRSPSALGKR